MQNTQGIKATIFHAMLPSEPEPSVTYTFRTEGGGSMELKFPLFFIELGDDFERWYREEKHVLVRMFHHDYRQNLEHKGNYYAKLIHDEFTTAWVHEQYYKDLIKIWESWNEEHLKKSIAESGAKNYQQANYHQEKIIENRLLILKAKAALYFINETKAFVKPDFGIPDIVQPTVQTLTPTVTISADTNEEKKKGGRTADPEIQKRNLDIFNEYLKYVKAECLPKKVAIDRVYKSYKKHFTGKPKNIKDQVRRIINTTQSDVNEEF